MSFQAKRIQTQLFLQARPEAAVGALTLAGVIKHSPGWGDTYPSRILGSFAVVMVLEGGGFFQDANGLDTDVRTGDLLLLFPEISHRYGPRKGQVWSEFYLVFQGPTFEFLRSTGVFNAGRPIVNVGDLPGYYAQFRNVIDEANRPDGGQTRAVIRLASLLTDLYASDLPRSSRLGDLTTVRNLLDADLGQPVDWDKIVEQTGWSYDTLRKRFGAEFGISPTRYRFLRRIEAAKSLLRDTRFANKEIAQILGFSDEFHFSKRFKQVVAMSPREYRLAAINNRL